jgi:hypothetical protein
VVSFFRARRGYRALSITGAFYVVSSVLMVLVLTGLMADDALAQSARVRMAALGQAVQDCPAGTIDAGSACIPAGRIAKPSPATQFFDRIVGGSPNRGILLAATSCVAGYTMCGGACKNIQTDVNNCGSCGTVCSIGDACFAGTCALRCPPGLVNLSGSCVDEQTDTSDCGGPGGPSNVCSAGQVCTSGSCSTPPAQTLEVTAISGPDGRIDTFYAEGAPGFSLTFGGSLTILLQPRARAWIIPSPHLPGSRRPRRREP